MTQPATIRCDRCGEQIPVTPESAYEFGYRCACGNAGVISWFHGSPPPTFRPRMEVQQELF